MNDVKEFKDWRIILATVVRVYLGYQWLHAGLGKITSPAWTGNAAGSAVSGFLKGALGKASGAHPEVQGWYAWFVENIALPNAPLFGKMVAIGEVLVGLGLILGTLTFFALLGGAFMNMNFLLAGTSSTSPVMLVLTIVLLYSHHKSSKIGFDYFIVPKYYPEILKPTDGKSS